MGKGMVLPWVSVGYLWVSRQMCISIIWLQLIYTKRNPPSCIWSEGGGGTSCSHWEWNEKLPTRICSKRGGELLSFHPLSTPWAVAHEAGGRWCVVSCLLLLSCPHCCCCCALIVVVLLSLLLLCSHCCHRHSTHYPPHKQLLMRLGVVFKSPVRSIFFPF